MKIKTKETLSKIAKELIPVVVGTTLAGIVKATNLPEGVLILPPLLQLTQRFNPLFKNYDYYPSFARDIWNTAKYAIGATLLYTPEIYQAIQNLTN